MSALKAFRDRSKAEAEALLKDSENVLSSLEGLLKQLFPHASTAGAQAAFANSLERNDQVLQSIATVQNALATSITNVQTLEHYIQLRIPLMEDGNNFGVTVQLHALKEMQDMRDKWTKSLEDLFKYASSRADAMDKLGLPQSTETSTTTATESKSTGGKDGDENKSSSVTTLEKKTTTGTASWYRQQAVIAVDVQYYMAARTALIALHHGYATILDYMEKNKDKLERPKKEGGSGFSSMY